MKAYTDIEQSKALAKILPLESADMYYWCGEDLRIGGYKAQDIEYDIPAWSLAALLDVLPYPSLHKTWSGWRCDSHDKEGKVYKFGESADNQIDACVDAIIKLHEQKLL